MCNNFCCNTGSHCSCTAFPNDLLMDSKKMRNNTCEYGDAPLTPIVDSGNIVPGLKKRKALTDGDAARLKRDKGICNCKCSSCDLDAFKEFVEGEVDPDNFSSNKQIRNHAYYTFSTEVKRVRGRKNQYSFSECCKSWIREKFPSS